MEEPVEVANEGFEDVSSDVRDPGGQERVEDAERKDGTKHDLEPSAGLRKRERHRRVAVHPKDNSSVAVASPLVRVGEIRWETESGEPPSRGAAKRGWNRG